jgi:diguanylate cyclase (GGDEF)-like protein
MLASVMASRNRLLAELRVMATQDALTGVLNRAGFMDAARSLVGPAGAGGSAVIMFDVDYFKSINDHLGHAAGDEVLTAIAKRAAAAIRSSHLLGRIGGEEFVAVVPSCTAAQAAAAAERIRSCMDRAPIILSDGRLVRVTISVGYAHGVCTLTNLERFLAEADLALYQAKSAGRNRVMPQTAPGATATVHQLSA